MKLLVKVLIAVALALGAVYYLGGSKDWDPADRDMVPSRRGA